MAADVSGGTCYSDCASPTCSVCPDNAYNTGPDNTGICTDCDEGKYIVSDDASDHTSADQCSACDVGYYLDSATSTCLACAKGKHAATSGQTSCDVCEVGKYAPTNGTAECTSCSAGSFLADDATNASMHDEATDCTICEPGTFVAEDASAGPCAVCALGTYAAEYHASGCTSCSAGSFLIDNATNATMHDEASDCMVCPVSEVPPGDANHMRK